MNIFSTASFAVVVAAIYKKRKTTKSAIIGFSLGTISLVITMVILNILLMPLFTGAPRETVIALLLPAIIPVNLIQATINSVASFTIFKSISKYVRIQDYDKM